MGLGGREEKKNRFVLAFLAGEKKEEKERTPQFLRGKRGRGEKKKGELSLLCRGGGSFFFEPSREGKKLSRKGPISGERGGEGKRAFPPSAA